MVALVGCAHASGQVNGLAPTPPSCPAETDEFISLGPGRTACVRSAKGPHPGDAGKGGGILRAGDCVALRGGERACSSKGWYGRVTGVAASVRKCPAGTIEALNLGQWAVVCLGRGGQVVSTGDCVVRPATSTSAGRIVKVDCSSGSAWAKVTGRVAAFVLSAV